jgi:hypothetical protein
MIITYSQQLAKLAYQLVLPHGLIRINIKIRFIANNYNYPSHALFHLLNILTYNTLKMHTHHYVVVIYLVSNNIFHFISHLHLFKLFKQHKNWYSYIFPLHDTHHG